MDKAQPVVEALLVDDAGITVTLSTDAPVVPDANPLLELKAAIDRHDHAGDVLGSEQGISPDAVLLAYAAGWRNFKWRRG